MRTCYKLGSKEIVQILLNSAKTDYILRDKEKVLAHILLPSVIRLFGYPFSCSRRHQFDLIMHSLMKRKDTKTILDIGCSSGFNSFALAERFPRSTIVGVDINPESIRVAKKISEVLRYPNLRFLIGDVCEIWKAFDHPVKFDTVLLLETLEHIKDDREAMISIKDLLHEDSSLYVSVPYSDRQDDLDHRIPVYTHIDKFDDDLFVGGHHFRDGYNLSRIQDLLVQSGLRVVDYHEIPFVPKSKLLFPFLYPIMSHMDSSRKKTTNILVEISLARNFHSCETR